MNRKTVTFYAPKKVPPNFASNFTTKTCSLPLNFSSRLGIERAFPGATRAKYARAAAP